MGKGWSSKRGRDFIYSLYVFEKDGARLLLKSSANSEYDIVNKYLKSIQKEHEDFKSLGSLSDMIYRMSFTMRIDGKKDEYMVIHNTL